MAKRDHTSDFTYVLGGIDREARRLQIQGQLLEPFTRRVFETAGIATGMKILDVGCGVGDVSLLAAKMVGPAGSVVGVDSNPAILETARQRVAAAGLSNITFVTGDIREVTLDHDFDAAVGRLVLIHIKEKVSALHAIAHHLGPDGILAFHEGDFILSEYIGFDETTPPLARQLNRWMTEAFGHAGADIHTGRSLPQTFLQAGLPRPHMSMDGVIIQGSEEILYDYLEDCLRKLLPLLLQFGIATEQEVDIDTFAERLRAEALRMQNVIIWPVMIGAWTRKVG